MLVSTHVGRLVPAVLCFLNNFTKSAWIAGYKRIEWHCRWNVDRCAAFELPFFLKCSHNILTWILRSKLWASTCMAGNQRPTRSAADCCYIIYVIRVQSFINSLLFNKSPASENLKAKRCFWVATKENENKRLTWKRRKETIGREDQALIGGLLLTALPSFRVQARPGLTCVVEKHNPTASFYTPKPIEHFMNTTLRKTFIELE